MALPVAGRIVRDWDLPAFSRWYAWLDPLVFKPFTIPIRIITAVGQHVFGRRQILQQRPCSNVIAALACRQEHAQGATESVRDGVQFRVHPALGSSNQATTPPFFRPRLEAMRCVFKWVASIISVSVPPPRSASSRSMRAKTPLSLHRFQRL